MAHLRLRLRFTALRLSEVTESAFLWNAARNSSPSFQEGVHEVRGSCIEI